MRTYLISYDLNRPGQDYSALFEAIKILASGWWHHLDSTWIIRSSDSAVAIRDFLVQHIDQNDKLFVALLAGEAAWYEINVNGSNWLKQHL